MLKSIEHLPRKAQKELFVLTDLIVKEIKEECMVILYGSYARNDYVVWDERFDFGGHFTCQSDYDLLVVTAQENDYSIKQRIESVVTKKYNTFFRHERRLTPVETIFFGVDKLNKEIERGKFFYHEILREGIVLHNTKEFQLAKPRILLGEELKNLAREEYDCYFPFGDINLRICDQLCERERLSSVVFQLHQACEYFYSTICAVFINYKPKCHQLEKYRELTNPFSKELTDLFTAETAFEKRCFDLLCRAYIEARYNRNYKITKEEIDYLKERTVQLKAITEKICLEKIDEYATRF